MRFRPCIDIHNGKVKQIVGGSLCDQGDRAAENFVAEQDASWYSDFYRKDGLEGGHVILLNGKDSPFYAATKRQAMEALKTFPGGLQVGGGIDDTNAEEFLEGGASHIIVTSFVFRNGRMEEEHLERLVHAVGKEHLVLDLSCRKKEGNYYIVTERWQNFTQVVLTPDVLDRLSGYCSEFLIHAVDVEGKASGIEEELASMLGEWGKQPVTYAGGVGSFGDLEKLRSCGRNRLDVTIGSALDLFGGNMAYGEVLKFCDSCRPGL